MKIPNNLKGLLLFVISVGYCLVSMAAPVQIQIHGIENKEILDNLQLALKDLADQQEMSDQEQRAIFESRALEEIHYSLEPFGYYEPTIKSHVYFHKSHWWAHFHLQLGRPILVDDLSFHLIGEGQSDPALCGIFALFPLKRGDVFVHPLYEQGKKAMLAKTIQHGYLKADYTEHRVEVDLEQNHSDIFLTLDSGPRHYFSQTTFTESKLCEAFLRRYLPYEFGEVYSPEKVLTLQNRLMHSDYFSQVNVKALPSGEDIAVPVCVETIDAKPNQYFIGAGYGTDTGVRGKLGWTRRPLNSRGHRLSAHALLSEIFNKVQVDYSIPGKRPYSDEVKISAAMFEDEFSEKQSRIYEAGIREFREIHGWERQIAMFYRHEEFKKFETYEQTQVRLVMPSITFIRTKRDDNLNPKRGTRLELSLRGAVDAMMSNANFIQAYMQYRVLHALSDSSKILFRSEFGATLPDNPERLPLSQRFFAGGDHSLRGYGYRSLPNEIDKDGNIRPVGGTYLVLGSLEFIQVIKKPFGVFTFVDAGNAFRPHVDDSVAVGVGAGVEWITRLGPLKVALAKPTDKNSSAWRVHASFGPEL